MSFFDDNKNIGLIVLLLGLANIIAGIAMLIVTHDSIAGGIVFLIGYLISGFIILITGLSIHASSEKFGGILSMLGGITGLTIAFDNQKGVVCLLLMVYGITGIITAIFTVIAYAIWGGLGGALVSIIIAFIIGIFFIYTATVISGDRQSSAGNILWIILLILIILGLLGALMLIAAAAVLGGFYLVAIIIVAILTLLLMIYLLLRVLSPEIKSAMGVT